MSLTTKYTHYVSDSEVQAQNTDQVETTETADVAVNAEPVDLITASLPSKNDTIMGTGGKL